MTELLIDRLIRLEERISELERDNDARIGHLVERVDALAAAFEYREKTILTLLGIGSLAGGVVIFVASRILGY